MFNAMMIGEGKATNSGQVQLRWRLARRRLRSPRPGAPQDEFVTKISGELAVRL
jgi:hypothetical protein